MNNNTLGVIFASDNESHLNDLTLHRTTASLPFAGRYRLIDFVLSNFVNANITTIGIVAKNNYNSLMDHIRMGRDWNLNRKNSGLTVFPPFVLNSSHDIYKGAIEALYSLRNFIVNSKEEYVVISNSNIAFNIDFDAVEAFHLEKGADITVLTHKTTEINPRKYVVSVDKNDRITDLRYPIASDPDEQLADLNIYYIKKDLLVSLIDNAYAHGAYDFEKEILQKELDNLYIMSYEVKSYVAVIDRIPVYFKHSMELLDPNIRNELFYSNSTILTKVKDSKPTKYMEGAVVKNSMIADGCEIDGTVENSILFRSVKVQKGAVVKNSIIMENGIIMENAKLNYVISDKNVIVQSGRELSGFESYPIVIVKGKVV
ncbi:MAG: glucose-1-phosphate adenylyltransferase subunit GlgD [Acidaminococcus sp.]|nr:glucose-1-phosphate adenylyltransferase subunit GlgD [Acidaminococcus sp.]MDD7398381.1 glucose-1-phosphate adenylyltransferase subunit GlgD [Bacillota bacterium]MDY4560004.1 glucose-1-phosphate adenylyltransferase subunit GlgD [Eubacteriales bacterium]